MYLTPYVSFPANSRNKLMSRKNSICRGEACLALVQRGVVPTRARHACPYIYIIYISFITSGLFRDLHRPDSRLML